MTVDDAIAEYLRTGRADPMHPQWPGANFFERARRATDDLLDALVAEVRSRASGKGWGTSVPLPADMAAYTRAKVEPMVRGLFARAEHDAILELLERSTVLVADETVEAVIRESGWLSTGWKVANLYLASIGAEVMDEASPSSGAGEPTTGIGTFSGGGSGMLATSRAARSRSCARSRVMASPRSNSCTSPRRAAW